MTDYTDVPKANALHEESQLVARALENLQAGGTLGSMQITPPPPAPSEPGVHATPPVMLMSVNLMVPPPVDAALLTPITAWLEQRLVAITAELTALGVTVPPAGSAAWSAPSFVSLSMPTPPPVPPPVMPLTTPPTTP
jgi:hypothetical protein